MNKHVVHHSYSEGVAWDCTPCRNHGRLYNVVPGTGYFGDSMHFVHEHSAIVIPPSDSLNNVKSVRVKAKIFSEALGGAARRMNIIEGHLTFAFFVNPDLSLQSTFYDPEGNWVGVRTNPRIIIPRQQWYDVEFRYDGLNAMEIFVNGSLMAAKYDLRGPVRSVGAHGIFIGHWPENDTRYTFSGYIMDVQIWKQDDTKPIKDRIDPCCLDEKKWQERLDKFRKKGYDRAYVDKKQQEFHDLLIPLMIKTRGDSEAGTREQRELLQRVRRAVKRRDYSGLSNILPIAGQWVLDRVTEEDLLDLTNNVAKFIDDLPVDIKEIEVWAKEICLSETIDTIKQSSQSYAEKIKRTQKKKSNQKNSK